MVGEVLKFGGIPSLSGRAPPSQIESSTKGKAEREECLRDESKSEVLDDFKQIVRADHSVEETSLGNFVASFSLFSGFGQEEVVVEVPNDAYQKQSNSNVFQINGWLRKRF